MSDRPVPVLVLRGATITTWLSGPQDPRRARVNGNDALHSLLGGNTLVVQVSAYTVRLSLPSGELVARLSVMILGEKVDDTVIFVDNPGWLEHFRVLGAAEIDPETWSPAMVVSAYRVEDR